MQRPLLTGQRWAATAAVLILLMGTVPAVRPDWFVGPTGSVRILYGPLGALLLAVGLVLRVRFAWYFTVGVLALLLLTLGILPLVAGGPILLLRGGPAVVAVNALGLAILAILTFIPSVRDFYRSRA